MSRFNRSFRVPPIIDIDGRSSIYQAEYFYGSIEPRHPARLEENWRQQEAGKREIFIRVTRTKPSDPKLVFPSFLVARCSSLNPLSSRCKNGSRIPRLRRSPWGLEVLPVRVSNSSNSPHCAPCLSSKRTRVSSKLAFLWPRISKPFQGKRTNRNEKLVSAPQ